MSAKKDGLLAWIIFFLVATFLMYEMALQMAPSVMTSQVMADLHLNAKTMSAAVGVYFFSYAAMQIPSGMIFDRFSARTIMTTVTAVCAGSAWLMGHAESSLTLAAARLLMGGASAFAFVGVLTAAYRWFSDQWYTFLVGMAQLLASVGAVFGTAPLAEYLSSVTWHTAFDQLAVVGVVLAFAIFLIVRQSPSGAAAHVEAIQMSFKDSFKTVGYNAQTWWLFFYAFLIWGPVTAFSGLWGADFIRMHFGISTVEASQFSWYFWLSVAATGPLWGYLTDYIGLRKPVMRYSSVLGLLATTVMIAYPDISMNMMRLMLVIYGVAASGHIVSFAVVKDINKPSVVSTASGVNNMGVVLGGLILQPLVGALLDYMGPDKIVAGAPVYSLHAYSIALSVMPICFFLGYLVSSWKIKETHCQSLYEH